MKTPLKRFFLTSPRARKIRCPRPIEDRRQARSYQRADIAQRLRLADARIVVDDQGGSHGVLALRTTIN
jgi:hypothetical protein